MPPITLGLAQINTRLGDVRANVDKHLDWIADARRSGADLVVFPELSLTGYVLQDLAAGVALRPGRDDPLFRRLLTASKSIDVMLGFVEAERRQRFYIAAAYLSRGEVVHVHRKVYLPTYGLFDEGRFFAPGDAIRAFETRFGRFGMLICEDFWHASPPYLLWLDGADMLLFASASPGRGLHREPRLASARWVEQINQAYASLFTTFVVHTNRVGFEDGLNFWGGATVFDPDGTLLVRGPYHQEALTLAQVDLDQLRRTRARLPLLRDERTSLVQRELERILAHESR
jgi:predicted amidohydrolase